MLLAAAYGTLLLFTPLSFCVSFYYFIKSPINWRKIFSLYVISLFMIGYCIESGRVTDMTRYFIQIENLKGLSLSDAIQTMNDRLYITDFFFWLSATFNMPHLVTGIPVALVIGVASYIACDYADESGEHHYLWIVLLLVLTKNSLSTLANNIRNVSAFSIAVLAVYREIKQKKKNSLTILLYILPIFIHTNGLLLVVARLLIPLVKRRRFFVLIIIAALPAIIEIAYSNVTSIPIGGSVGVIIRRLIYSAHHYLAGTSSYARSQAASTNAQIKRIIAFSRLGFTTLIIYKELKENPTDFKAYTLILASLALSCTAFNTPAYWRFSTALLIANIPMYFNIISGRTIVKRSPQLLKIGLVVFTLISFVLKIDTIMDDVNIGYFTQEILSSNIFVLLFECIPYLFV